MIRSISGLIDRRFLINYRVAPEVLARQIPVMLRWIADPLVARASRRTLDGTLEDTIRMLQRER